ncbi:MAG TPA: TIGR03067 domain-containing protein [Gemmataceae bacterium]|nr:TIGR03067 domain-containing protein [Gemmataceae bacterium]
MWWSQLKFVAAVLFAVGMLGASLFTVRMLAADQSPRREAPALLRAPSPAADAGEEARRKAELKKLQGTWNVAALEIDGAKIVGPAFQGSKIIVQDDAFTTISMGAAYKGTLKLDQNSTPKKLDLVFTEGPEKGKTNLGIYELDGDTWKICLALAGNTRPVEFVTKVGSGFALEILQRQAEEKNSETLDKEFSRLQGEWSMVSGEHDGQRVPEGLLKLWKRVAKGKETTVTFSGQVMLQATFTLDMSKKPKTIDYTMAEGPNKGKKQYGVYEWDGDQVRFCFAVPGKERPKEFATKAGDQQTLSVWKKVNP